MSFTALPYMPCPHANLPALLAPLRWTRMEVEVENLENQFAREHPLSILQAVCLFATRGTAPDGGRPNYTWHFLREPGHRIRKAHRYRISLQFPGDALDTARRVRDGFARHLADPRNHFRLVECSEPSLRCAKDLPQPPDTVQDGDEICLFFRSPLPFPRAPGAGKWSLETQNLLDLIGRRMAQAFAVDVRPILHALFTSLQILPWYWDYQEIVHRARSGAGKNGKGLQYFNGCAGPLYLRGPVRTLWPLLALLSEIQLHTGTHSPQGHFQLLPHHPVLDAKIVTPLHYHAAWQRILEDSDLREDLLDATADPQLFCEQLAASIRGREWHPGTARQILIPKPAGGQRRISMLSPADRILHRTLHELLSPHLDRALSDTCRGFRKGMSISDTRKKVAEAVRDGFTWVFETDLEDFFDHVAWAPLLETLRDLIPRADSLTLELLERLLRTPVVEASSGRTLPRYQGLLQGSPLSPLLANLYLSGFDAALATPERRVLRYGDDVLVLCRSRSDAETAATTAAAFAARLGMTLKESKTRVAPLDEEVRFLGFDLGPGLEEETVARCQMKRTLYVRENYALVGVDGGSVVIKSKGHLIDRIPLHRVGEIVLLGNNVVSALLVQRCLRERVPVTFCTVTGYYLTTVHPDSRQSYERAARHHHRHDALTEPERVHLARRLVEAKLYNSLHTLRGWSDPKGELPLHEITQALNRCQHPQRVEELLGVEGHAAHLMFQALNRQIRTPEFRAPTRKPHNGPDRLNAVLDFAYYLLFVRLNVLVRAHSLNPWLGFLHSPKNRYESLVCDLQEPFRARVDRFVAKTLNLKIIQPDDMSQNPKGKWRMTGPATARFVEAFERELQIRMSGDPGTFLHLLEAQVFALQEWVDEGKDLRLYVAKRI